MRRRAAAALGVFALVGLGACEPCSGIASCTVETRLGVRGRIVRTEDGGPVPGARVTVVWFGPDSTPADSATGTTDARGDFAVAVQTPGALGPVPVDIVVMPPQGDGYRVRSLRLRPSDRRGDDLVLATWVDRPYIDYAGEAWPLGETEGRTRLVDQRIAFRRIGGAELTGPGWTGDTVSFTTDHAGRFPLLGRRIQVRGIDTVYGQVALVSNGALAFDRDTFPLVPTHIYRRVGPVRVFRLGLNFPYAGQTRLGGDAIGGVRVDFTRADGVPGAPTSFSVVSDGAGYFFLDRFVPEVAGEVLFDLTFTPPPPLVPFTKRVSLPVHGGVSFGERFAVFRVDRPDAPPTPFFP